MAWLTAGDRDPLRDVIALAGSGGGDIAAGPARICNPSSETSNNDRHHGNGQRTDPDLRAAAATLHLLTPRRW